MKEYNATGNYYTIGHISQFTGLTDRTIRSYIASGLLQGEKINGLWHFTADQVDAFMGNPNVRPSILAKKNAVVYDFLLDRNKQQSQICAILDLPEGDPKETMEFFCDAVNNGQFREIRLSCDYAGGVSRVILRGYAENVMILLNRYYAAN